MSFSSSSPPPPPDHVDEHQPIPGEPVLVGADDGPVYWVEPPPSSTVGPKVKRLGIELIQTVVLAFLLFMAVRALAQNFRVEGSSMEPGLHNGQYLLVNKAIYYKINLKTLSKYIPFVHAGDNPNDFIIHGPQRGDVIVFKFPQQPSRDFIKRVIALPGDTVEIKGGVVYVDGHGLDEPYIRGIASNTDYEKTVIPQNNYFVLGDNRGNSSDSRAWGFVPEANIIGKAEVSYWPLDDVGGIGNHHVDLGFIKVRLPRL